MRQEEPRAGVATCGVSADIPYLSSKGRDITSLGLCIIFFITLIISMGCDASETAVNKPLVNIYIYNIYYKLSYLKVITYFEGEGMRSVYLSPVSTENCDKVLLVQGDHIKVSRPPKPLPWTIRLGAAVLIHGPNDRGIHLPPENTVRANPGLEVGGKLEVNIREKNDVVVAFNKLRPCPV